ncbi:hypothetical protein ABMA27_012291 [Loxostege sticticalis]|uniref:C2H2-type domain-containing protein n=1 Tax=Loxostege sticticalis TaxID=481309 RepID=A0ABR3H0T5_LOXSC
MEEFDEKKDDIMSKLICNGCLCIGRTLHKITDGKLARFYMDALQEIPSQTSSMPLTCPTLCWECKAYLKKAATFKQQVQDSHRILQAYTSESLRECLVSDVIRSSHLSVQIDSLVSIEPEPQTEVPICSPPSNRFDTEQCVFFKDEPKIESIGVGGDDKPMATDDGFSDLDDTRADAEVVYSKKKKKKKKNKLESKIKRTQKVVKRLQNGAKTAKKTKNNQKILTIELSYEELLLEREKEEKKQSYQAAEFKCESCLIGFNYSKSYKAHIAMKHAPELGNYICPICKTAISSVDSFTAHYRRHLRRYECSICQKRTMDMKVMQQHYLSTHEISLKEYKCDLCGKISNSIDAHRYHKDTHKARVQCPECDKTFTHRAGLLNHRLSVHELCNKFPCNLCDKVFRWKNSLKRHLEKHVDTSPSAACCEDCGVTFQSVSSYQRHLKNSLKHVTQQQLRFICDHCGRRFADKTKIRDHIEEKHLHKTYSCHICLKQSKNRVSLDQHIRNVHKGRPNNKVCHHCGKAFPTKMQLESHIRTHTGERPFICEFCPTTFTQQSNLYKHNRQVHLNIKSKRYPIAKKRKEDKPTEQVTIEVPSMDPYRPVAILQYSPAGLCTSIPY